MQEGMRYACQRCGNCCRWPGEVPITEDETARIAEFLGLELYDFVARFTEVRRNRTGLTIREKENDECVFLDGIECKIQSVKPDHCKGFPNRWNFPGWRKVCEAVPVALEQPGDAEKAK
ncbi:MAG: zinc/iron-chelating domain-containing protein [Verrucomicrobiales bacterium]|nr:zinc/iron-chelating domain-containing protein [Verrucomicrobiales bacterium]